MSDGLQHYLEVASGLTRTTLGATERAVAQFVRQGEVAAEYAERLLDEVIARSVDGSGAVAQLVRTEVARALERAGVARAEEVEELRRQVDELARRLAAGGLAAESPPAEVPPAESPAAEGLAAGGPAAAGAHPPQAPQAPQGDAT